MHNNLINIDRNFQIHSNYIEAMGQKQRAMAAFFLLVQNGLIRSLKLAVSNFLYPGACRYMGTQFKDGYCMATHHVSSLNASLNLWEDLLSSLSG